jgi:DNA (cytosine-5)-methyltransferase 1
VYRMHPDMPANTITSTVASTTAHWSDPAELSPQELVRIQTFPDDFDFRGARPKYVLGMSVPPLMMQRLALEIRRQLVRR